MSQFAAIATGVFDQLNPFNTGNLIIYFGWLGLFTFTGVAVWRSDSRWLRLSCFVVNQVFSVGIILSWTLTSLLAYTYWRQSFAVVVATLTVAIWAMRTRSPAEEALT